MRSIIVRDSKSVCELKHNQIVELKLNDGAVIIVDARTNVSLGELCDFSEYSQHDPDKTGTCQFPYLEEILICKVLYSGPTRERTIILRSVAPYDIKEMEMSQRRHMSLEPVTDSVFRGIFSDE